MTQEIFLTLLRHVLSLVGGGLIVGGYIDPTSFDTIAGAILAIGGVGWGLYSKRRDAVLKNAASLPEVEGIVVTSPEVAAKVPSEKVYSLRG